MAQGDCIVLNNFKEQMLLKSIDCDTDVFKVALYSVALASPDGADVAYSVTNEISGSGYTAGGATVQTPVVTQDDANDRAKWDDDGSNLTWSSLAANTILEARLYDDTTATKWVLLLWEIATNSNGANYSLNFHAECDMLLTAFCRK
ncbi:MAG: hypothetical protein U9R58_02685 [Chloroflexota bacterium]|nr:hypothetical protein [Chloroflexota bacterium]